MHGTLEMMLMGRRKTEGHCFVSWKQQRWGWRKGETEAGDLMQGHVKKAATKMFNFPVTFVSKNDFIVSFHLIGGGYYESVKYPVSQGK